MKLTIPYLLLSLLAWVYAFEAEVKNGLISNEYLADKRAASSLETTDDRDIDVSEVAHRRAEPFLAPYRVNSNNEPLRSSYRRKHGKHLSRSPAWFRNRGKWSTGGSRHRNVDSLNLGENVHGVPVEHPHGLPPYIIEPVAHLHSIPSHNIERGEHTHGLPPPHIEPTEYSHQPHISESVGHPHGIIPQIDESSGHSHDHLPRFGLPVPSAFRNQKKKPFRVRKPFGQIYRGRFGFNKANPNWQRSSAGSRLKAELEQIISQKKVGRSQGQKRNRFWNRNSGWPTGRHHNRGRNRHYIKNRVFGRYRYPHEPIIDTPY